MELPLLKYTTLPNEARRIVERFLWKPHPTAVMMQDLGFERDLFDFGWRVWGPTLRMVNVNVWPPRYEADDREKDWANQRTFNFRRTTGETRYGASPPGWYIDDAERVRITCAIRIPSSPISDIEDNDSDFHEY